MSAEQNKKIIQRLFNEGMMQKKFQVFDELIADKFVNHGMPGAKTGPSGFKEVVQRFTNAFPDMQINIQETVAEGESVATRGFMSGTHQGEFMGIAATGKKVRIDYIDFWKLSNGKCVENWVQMDMPAVWKQLTTKEHAL